MSRGLGRCEREVLLCLLSYRGMGEALGLRWRDGGSFYRDLIDGKYAGNKYKIDSFERGDILEIRRIQRDLQIRKGVLSRTLRGLERKELLWLYCADLTERWDKRWRPSSWAKFVGLTDLGVNVADKLKCEPSKNLEVRAYVAGAA